MASTRCSAENRSFFIHYWRANWRISPRSRTARLPFAWSFPPPATRSLWLNFYACIHLVSSPQEIGPERHVSPVRLGWLVHARFERAAGRGWLASGTMKPFGGPAQTGERAALGRAAPAVREVAGVLAGWFASGASSSLDRWDDPALQPCQESRRRDK